MNIILSGTFLPFDIMRHFGVTHIDYGLCHPCAIVEMEAIELADDGPDSIYTSADFDSPILNSQQQWLMPGRYLSVLLNLPCA